MSKMELRQWASGLEPPTDSENAAVVARLDEVLSGFPGAAVLVYLSKAGEVAAEGVVGRSDHGCRFYTTRTPQFGGLTIHGFDEPREMHRFGFPQPVATARPVPPAALDVVLVPGLAFDLSGGRLGWGKGYYDHLISELRDDAALVGVGLERRLVESIPMESHDVPMHLIVTEVRTWRVPGSGPTGG